MKAVLIYNPRARQIIRQPDRVDQIDTRLRRRGVEAELWATKEPGHATALARRAVAEGKDLVIAYGGDGTIHEIVGGLAQTTTPLAIIPGGTANVLAQELNIPFSIEKAIDRLVTGTPQRIALGQVGSKYFHAMAGIGVDASVVRAINPILKGTLGVGGFWLEGFKHLYSYDMPVFDIRVNGKQYRATWAVISNTKRYGGGFRITPRASIRESVLDVCIFTTRSKLRYVKYVPLAYFGAHVRDACVSYIKAESVQAAGDPSIGVQADGEWVGALPCEVRVVPQALTIIS